jgi:hypothetical protein
MWQCFDTGCQNTSSPAKDSESTTNLAPMVQALTVSPQALSQKECYHSLSTASLPAAGRVDRQGAHIWGWVTKSVKVSSYSG